MEQDYLQHQGTKRLFTRQNIILLAGCLLGTAASFLFALMYGGAFPLSISDLFNGALQSEIMTEIRLPLSINALLYGIAMGVAGVLLQRATRFTAVCPSTLGLVPAGILAILIAMQPFELHNEWAISLIGTLGSCIGLLLMYLISLVIPIKAKGMRLLVGGLLSTGVFGVMLMIAVIKWGEKFPPVYGLQTGLFTTGSVLVPISLICFLLALLLSGQMNRSSDPIWLIAICIALAIVLTGTAITTLGVWAMIGLIASNVARWLVRSEDYRVILPAAAMIGAVVVSVLHTISYLINPPLVTPLHSLTALTGLPLLTVLIWKEAVRYAAVSQADQSVVNPTKETTIP